MRSLFALLFVSSSAFGQEAPLQKGQFETMIGVQVSAPTALFREDGSSQSLDEALVLTSSTFRSLSLYSQITYALDRKILLSLSGPLVRSATLTGENVLSQDVTFERIEQVTGPGDISLSLALIPRPMWRTQRGALLSVSVPVGSDEARLPLGSGLVSAQVGVFAYQSLEPFFVRASLNLGNSNSLSAELTPSLSIGRFFGRVSVEQELRGLIPLTGVPDISVEARDILTGAAAQRSLLRSVSTLRVSLGDLQPTFSLQWRVVGQNEVRGLSYFVGVRVAPRHKKDNSKSGVP